MYRPLRGLAYPTSARQGQSNVRRALPQVAILTAMNADGADFTNTFRALAAVDAEADAPGSIPPALQEVQLRDR